MCVCVYACMLTLEVIVGDLCVVVIGSKSLAYVINTLPGQNGLHGFGNNSAESELI